MYAKGRGVEKDETKAFMLWAQAAEQGHASAQYNLGAMYATGRGVDKDLSRAVHLYHQAATQGVVQAQYSLGLMYQYVVIYCTLMFPVTSCVPYLSECNPVISRRLNRYGKSVEQSTDMAVDLFTRAARQGHAKAQQHLDQIMGSSGGGSQFDGSES